MSPASKTVIETRGEREIVIRRSFDAPAELVFDAWTNPDVVSGWWVPEAHGVEGVRFEADVRVGGSWRYVLRAPAESPGETGGAGAWAEFAMSGRYIEVVRPSRLVYTEVFEPTAAGPSPEIPESVVTVTFEEERGRTHLVSRIVCASQEFRDAYLANMEPATSAAMDKLAGLVESKSSN
jgi:uncharacterized protein YndB with AHSA1/START domain